MVYKYNIRELILETAFKNLQDASEIRRELKDKLGFKSPASLMNIERALPYQRSISMEQAQTIENYFSGKLKRKITLEIRREGEELPMKV